MWFIICAIILAYFIYKKILKPMKYWEERGVPFVKPLPFVGNMGEIFIQKRAMTYVVHDIYKQAEGRRYIGCYNFNSPSLMVCDPDLIKQITVKEFDTFPEHRQFIMEGVDPLWSKNLFAMRGGQKWHNLRSTLSPSFTSNKMRMMFELMRECSKQFSNYYLEKKGPVTLDMKDAFTRFTNDVIATTAFGVTCDSLKDKENEFYLMGKEAVNFTGIKGIIFLIHFVAPYLAKLLGIKVFSKTIGNFFRSIITDTMKIREEKGIVRPDMIHLLMQARKGQLKSDETDDALVNQNVTNAKRYKEENQKGIIEITDDDITAQALIFFFAGFESVSTMMSFAAYELAINPDVQDKVRNEVDTILSKYKGEFTYDAVMELKYLEMVLHETLRKWPSFATTDRQAVKPFTIEPKEPNEVPVHLNVGDRCLISMYSIQRDPRYFPNPDKFDPERFSDENKHNITPFTYLPFGTGPRNCIGSRFALLEGKLILAEIISKFVIEPTERTPVPLILSRKSFNPVIADGYWLRLKPRNI